ncbi:MAG: bifunctional riboflavin kinase/FAD synthetase [Candidatus Methylomirabilis oxygeniifera]|uniref:Riboflavin biosynthesis protein n=1 Tax=Methylomirabilis oxygeniifera TaxID=671143 RepID=D5MKK7_METO1|nr:MAG: bifunctional riboflavin kinase/FAD synthetase [Candidatus Methylomirabilis oxyfera]CBE67654.1 Riboflavin biosynthesis protein RibF [Candidatus Methylomirabilis oxyfera]
MIVIEQIEDLEQGYPFPAVAVGTFDGVHLGHREILGRVVRRAHQEEGTAVVFTFSRHPLEVVNPSKAPPLLTPLPIKQDIMAALGVDLMIAVGFTPSLAATAPRDFVNTYMVDRLQARFVCIGYDFAFGQARAGSPELLRALGEEHQFELDVVPAMTADGQVVSSTRIRGLLARGELREATRCLGRPYAVMGQVERGAERGRWLGYPTANLAATGDLIVPDGVYAGMVWLKQRLQKALINVGRAPTFGGEVRRVEVHVLEADEGELYGEMLTLLFLERLRDERRFDDPSLLRRQIDYDKRQADEIFTAFPQYSAEEWALLPEGPVLSYSRFRVPI